MSSYQTKPETKKHTVTEQKNNAQTVQLKDNRQNNNEQKTIQKHINQSEKVIAQREKATNISDAPVQRQENKTGLPNQLKSGIEQLSGVDMSDTSVHYNSSAPAQLQAHAFAQGNNIHVAPGQEQHLAHEAWHVVQQKQGRVKATKQLKSKTAINDDPALEKEADIMGAKAMQLKSTTGISTHQSTINTTNNLSNTVLQPKWLDNKQSEFYKWDAMVEGVRWYHHKQKDLMYYLIEDRDVAKESSFGLAGIQNARTRQEWVELAGVDTMAEVDASIVEQQESQIASKDDHEALIAQFEDLSSTGGLLMHAMAGGEEVDSVGYLLKENITLEEIRKGNFRTKLLSYIRSDMTMQTFSFRKVGLLVDWKRIWDMVGYMDGHTTIYEEDQQSSRTALDNAQSFKEAGGDMDLMGTEYHLMAQRQNALKKKSNVGNWNEVLMYNGATAGVVGLLWIVDGSKSIQLIKYEDFFTEDKKEKLYKIWYERTGMEEMPIYIYTHLGNPKFKAKREARKKLGKKGASTLVLREKFKPKKVVKSSSPKEVESGPKEVSNVNMEAPMVQEHEASNAQMEIRIQQILHIGDRVRVGYHSTYDIVGTIQEIGDERVKVRVTNCYKPKTNEEFQSEHTRTTLGTDMIWDKESIMLEH